jgi:hypothetical protein
MREFIAILEAFHSPMNIEWKKTDDSWFGEFQTPSDRWFQILIIYHPTKFDFDKKDFWTFEFRETPQASLYATGRIKTIDLNLKIGQFAPTDRGEAFYVYSSVFAGMRQFLIEIKPRQVKFKGATPKQTQFYMAIMQRYKIDITSLGYVKKGAGLVQKNYR